MASCHALLCCVLVAAGVTGALAAGRSTGGNSTVVICPDVAPFECTPDHPAVLQVTPGYDLYPCQDYWNAYDYPCPGSTRKSTCTFDLSTVNVTEELVASYLADKCDNTAGCQAFTYIAAYHLAFLKGANSGETFHVEERCTTDNKTSLWVKTSSAKPFPGKSHTGAIVGSVIGVLLALALAAVAAYAFHNNLWCFANWRASWYNRADGNKKMPSMPSVALPSWMPGAGKRASAAPMSGHNPMSHERMHDVEMPKSSNAAVAMPSWTSN